MPRSMRTLIIYSAVTFICARIIGLYRYPYDRRRQHSTRRVCACDLLKVTRVRFSCILLGYMALAQELHVYAMSSSVLIYAQTIRTCDESRQLGNECKASFLHTPRYRVSVLIYQQS